MAIADISQNAMTVITGVENFTRIIDNQSPVKQVCLTLGFCVSFPIFTLLWYAVGEIIPFFRVISAFLAVFSTMLAVYLFHALGRRDVA